MKLAIRAGSDAFYAKARALGFGQKSGAELHAEVGGRLPRPTRRNHVSLAGMAIGHEVLVTPIQLLNAYCCVANGGLLFQPTLIQSTTDGGKVVPIPVRRALVRSDADKVIELLEGVVRSGTGVRAAHPGISVAGKTGTAQKADPGGVGYRAGAYISTFAGFFPSEHPAAAMLVIVDEPQGQYYAGTVCAPVFRRVVDLLLASPGGCLYPTLAASLSTAPLAARGLPPGGSDNERPQA
jgi:cell division protein FtsI/penicillin-binding protein 2